MKPHRAIILATTFFWVAYLLLPKVQACVAALDPCYSNHVTKSVPVTTETQPVKDGKVFGPVIFFVIILMVAAYIVYQLIKLLDKVIPPEKKPEPPPQSGNTNYPPVVINPNSSPGPAIATKRYEGKMSPLTNYTGCTITNYNISTYGWINTWERVEQPFDHYWTVTMSHSTNTLDWEDSHYQIECFSTTGVGVLYRYLHYGTNYFQCYYTSDYLATNHAAPAYFDLTDKPYQPQRFFRLESK